MLGHTPGCFFHGPEEQRTVPVLMNSRLRQPFSYNSRLVELETESEMNKWMDQAY